MRARRSARSGGVSSATSVVQAERGARVLHIELELGRDRVDALELALTAQEVGELHLRLLAVEVAVEVEEVSLEQRRVGVGVEGRAAAEVDRAGMTLAVGSLIPTGVHAVGRQTHLVR